MTPCACRVAPSTGDGPPLPPEEPPSGGTTLPSPVLDDVVVDVVVVVPVAVLVDVEEPVEELVPVAEPVDVLVDDVALAVDAPPLPPVPAVAPPSLELAVDVGEAVHVS